MLPGAQNVVGPEMVTLTALLTVTDVCGDVAEQPAAFVTVTL